MRHRVVGHDDDAEVAARLGHLVAAPGDLDGIRDDEIGARDLHHVGDAPVVVEVVPVHAVLVQQQPDAAQLAGARQALPEDVRLQLREPDELIAFGQDARRPDVVPEAHVRAVLHGVTVALRIGHGRSEAQAIVGQRSFVGRLDAHAPRVQLGQRPVALAAKRRVLAAGAVGDHGGSDAGAGVADEDEVRCRRAVEQDVQGLAHHFRARVAVSGDGMVGQHPVALGGDEAAVDRGETGQTALQRAAQGGTAVVFGSSDPDAWFRHCFNSPSSSENASPGRPPTPRRRRRCASGRRRRAARRGPGARTDRRRAAWRGGHAPARPR